MFMIVTSLILWIPAILGWGSISLIIRRLCRLPDIYAYDVLEPILGMALLAIYSSMMNYFTPVCSEVSSIAILIGWILSAIRFYKTPRNKKISWSIIILAILWLFMVALWSTQPPQNYDSGLYHLSSIKWTNESPLPLGLANLHGRLGFNSSWFPLAALVEIPFYQDNIITSSFILTALLVWFYGVEIIHAMLRLVRNRLWTLQNIFLLLSTFFLIWFIPQMCLSSPSPDTPIIIFTLLTLSIALQELDLQKNWTYSIFITLFIAIFSITI